MKKRQSQRTGSYNRMDGAKKRAADKQSRFTIPPAIIRSIAYTMIAIAVILSWFMTPYPVATGFTILALIRIGITIREDRREQAGIDAVCKLSSSR